MLRKTLKGIGVLLIIPALLGGYWLWVSFAYIKPYHRIAPDDSEARVISLMGRPHRIETERAVIDTALNANGDFAAKGRESVKQFVYTVPDITGDEYVVSFDSEGHVVAKMERISP